MTEAEWSTCSDPAAMVGMMANWTSERKLRLFSCGAVRQVWDWLVDERSRNAVEAAELYADGLLSHDQLERACRDAHQASQIAESLPQTRLGVAAAAWTCDSPARVSTLHACRISNHQSHLQHQANLLRCIFGNPFREAVFADSWRSERGVALASAIYTELAFDRMSILADALEEAGCDHADILSHCRGPGPHVRGCWVVDLVLGKS